MLLLERARPPGGGPRPCLFGSLVPGGRGRARLRFIVCLTALGVWAARPLQAQEPDVPDSAAAGEAAADTTPPGGAADTTRGPEAADITRLRLPSADSAAAAVDKLAPADSPTAADSVARADSAAADSAEAAAADTLQRVRSDIVKTRERLEDVKETLATLPEENKLARSPRGAVLRAFALPGWGQFYTGHPVRGFLYGGAEVAFGTLGYLRQRQALDLRDEIFRAKLDFVAADQELHPDSAYSKEDTLELYDRFAGTAEALTLEAELSDKQKSREDFFTYAIFSVLFSAIDAFVSAHLEPFDATKLDVTPQKGGWRIDLQLPLGRDPAGSHSPPGVGRSGEAFPP